MHIENIVVGKPIVDLGILLGTGKGDTSFKEYTVFDTERNLHELLVKYGIMKSKREIRRNRPDLIKNLDKLDCLQIKVGKKKLWIIVGV